MIKEYYKDDRHIIYQGDVLEALRSNLQPDSVDLLVTSPPYNVGKDYGGKTKDDRPYESYLDWLYQIVDASWRVLVPGGRIAININDHGRNPLYPTHAYLLTHFRNSALNWIPMACVVWDKLTPMGNTAWGSWQMASAPCFRGHHEYILIAAKLKTKKLPRIPGSLSGPWYDTEKERDFVNLTREIWRFSPSPKTYHPAPFPFDLPSRLIRLLTYYDDFVLDPFVGSGTTLQAANQFGRRGIGIDINPLYCSMAADSIRQSEMFPKRVGL